jgi:putative endonuclease
MALYFVYILTNKSKTVFCVGLTKNLKNRYDEINSKTPTNKDTFEYKAKATNLIYYKAYTEYVSAHLAEIYLKRIGWLKRETEMKKENPELTFLNL